MSRARMDKRAMTKMLHRIARTVAKSFGVPWKFLKGVVR